LDINTLMTSPSKSKVFNTLEVDSLEDERDLDVVRRRQRNEVISAIKQEELLEKQRIMLLKDTTRKKEDMEALQKQFTLERRDAQLRLQQLMRKHEGQLKTL
jgi:alpha-D-ribose 1-methylphosphonate 5-triphosphate synthase subunit PhnI